MAHVDTFIQKTGSIECKIYETNFTDYSSTAVLALSTLLPPNDFVVSATPTTNTYNRQERGGGGMTDSKGFVPMVGVNRVRPTTGLSSSGVMVVKDHVDFVSEVMKEGVVGCKQPSLSQGVASTINLQLGKTITIPLRYPFPASAENTDIKVSILPSRK